ncbi:MAG: CotH kinase family protein [Oscillospiraceae bacterium]|nr:CotH kinase family protein [Oscillospiraceae bacterium]
MFELKSSHKRYRALTACALLCALLLGACGLPASAPAASGAPGTATAAPVQEAEPTPAPTPEPTPEPFRTEVVLSELQAANKATLPDADGDFSDWIELYNPSGETQDLSGCWLSDDKGDPCKWRIPELTLAGGEYKLIFCSKKDRSEGELHTNFKLSGDGDSVFLSSPEGELLWQADYESCPTDAVLCFEDGKVRTSYYPTPGWPNTEDGCEAFNAANDRHGKLVINEAVTYNDDFYFHAGAFYDWIELKNDSNEDIRLSDYFVSDDSDEPFAFQLPDTILRPSQTFVVYCGEAVLPSTSCHAPFKLDSKGDCVYIYHADGSLCDYVSLYGVPLNHSKGRLDGKSGFFLFAKRTPAAANGAGARMIAMRPESVTPPGIYNNVDGLDVELSGEGTIYYTLNGTLPDASSEVYTGPIHLSKTTLIRAVSATGGKLRSETASFTYVINENHDLPVVCIALEPMKLGVLHNNGNMEYDSHTEFYDLDGGSFSSDCMITLHGAASRSVWAKKSFKVVFRDRYGGDISYDLFGQGITEFHSLNLRGGDTVTLKTFREPLAAEFAERVAAADTDPLTLDSRFCVLYIDGEYRGIYTLREAYSKKYIESHTGSDEELSIISRAPINQPEMRTLYSYIVSCNISDPDTYSYISDRLDLKSMAQWLLLETYFNNLDPTGNIRYCRGNQPDNKWRTMFFDLDISMENGQASIWAMIDPNSEIGRMFTVLLRSGEFKKLMLETASELYQNGLSYELALEILNRMVYETSKEMPRNLRRWGESQQLYENKLAATRNTVFTQARDDSWLNIVKVYTGADDETMAAYFPER